MDYPSGEVLISSIRLTPDRGAYRGHHKSGLARLPFLRRRNVCRRVVEDIAVAWAITRQTNPLQILHLVIRDVVLILVGVHEKYLHGIRQNISIASQIQH